MGGINKRKLGPKGRIYDSRKRRNPFNERRYRLMPLERQDEDRFYVVEKLLDRRHNQDTGREEYLVRWQNYPPEWDSWEPRTELERNALDMVNEFDRTSTSQFQDFQLHCICRQPYRFDQGGMIQCFHCHTWYHFKCLHMDMEEANSYAKYYCHECKRMNPGFKSMVKIEKLTTFYGMTLAEKS